MKSLRTVVVIALALLLDAQRTWRLDSALAAPLEPLHLEVFTGNEDSWGVTSTLIYGKTEAILIDSQFRISQAQKLADRIEATGRHLKGIVITHPDDDHYIGTAVIHERFPYAPIYMTARALEEFKRSSGQYLAAQKAKAPSETPDSLPTPEALPTTIFSVDGQAVDVIQDFQGDVLKSMNSFLWVPSLDAVIAGDLVFSGVHPWLADSNEESRSAWHHSLELISALHPRVVVAGHKGSPDLADSPEAIAFMHNYLNDFESAKRTAAHAEELVAAMTRKFPDLKDERFLAYAAKAAFPTTPQAQPSVVRAVDLRASDGTILKASYFAAAKPGPGVLLFHQVNRTRKSWDDVAVQLAAAGINTLTVDLRGFGESGGTPYDKLTKAERHDQIENEGLLGDRDTAWQYLVSQPGVDRNVIGVGGAGLLGVGNSVQTARQHPAEVKSLALLSGETFQGLQYLQKTPRLPGLFVVDDNDEYPPTVEAMELAYISSPNPGKKFVHYSAAEEAPWVWYEPNDVGKVPATGGHGTDMFRVHSELPGIIVDWFVTTLIKTPGHAPADTVASAATIDEIRSPGGVEKARQQLLAARQKDPKAQLWPEITVSIIGQDHLRAGETKPAVEILELNLLAYSDSADAEGSLADAYLDDGQKDLARQHAEKALALLDTHSLPASSWTDSNQYRGEIRRDAQEILKKLGTGRR